MLERLRIIYYDYYVRIKIDGKITVYMTTYEFNYEIK